MRVLMLEAPRAMLDERRRLGHDRRDEMWDGVLHLVPLPGGPHQRMNSELLLALGPVAKRLSLIPLIAPGLFRSECDLRVPDQLYCREADFSERGAEGAELVVEILSPGDETYDKIDFYAELGVPELLVVHPEDRRVEMFRAVGGRLLPVQASRDGGLGSEALGVEFRTVDGRLVLTWAEGSAEI